MNVLEHYQETALAMFGTVDIEQGSPEWHQMRLGLITASEAHNIFKGKSTQAYRNYVMKIAAEILTGLPQGQFSAKTTDWGKNLEPKARETYQFITGDDILELPFIWETNEFGRIGISPDGICLAGEYGTEIKCPADTAVHIDFCVNGIIKPEHRTQCETSIFVGRKYGINKWRFISYDPRIKNGKKIAWADIELTEERANEIDHAVDEFLADVNSIVKAMR